MRQRIRPVYTELVLVASSRLADRTAPPSPLRSLVSLLGDTLTFTRRPCLCAGVISVTPDVQIAKNPMLYQSGLQQSLGDRFTSTHTHTRVYCISTYCTIALTRAHTVHRPQGVVFEWADFEVVAEGNTSESRMCCSSVASEEYDISATDISAGPPFLE